VGTSLVDQIELAADQDFHTVKVIQ
jgi:hypothetical protein